MEYTPRKQNSEAVMRFASLSLLAALAFAPFAGAQITLPDNAASRPAPGSALPQTPDTGIFETLSSVLPQITGGAPVKGLPFSAKETVVHEQNLADGTTISNTTEARFWRDAEGRMRIEYTLHSSRGGLQGRMVSVRDPVQGTFMTWIADNQYAHVVTLGHLPQIRSSEAPEGTVSVPPSRPGLAGQPQPGTSQRVTLPEIHPPASSANVHTENLGSDTIAGVYAEGTRTTTVIPAGTSGNDREISVIQEIWASPDLKFTMRQVRDDPRTGTWTTEVTSLDRSDPDPALFRAPEGYTILKMPRLPVSAPAAQH